VVKIFPRPLGEGRVRAVTLFPLSPATAGKLAFSLSATRMADPSSGGKGEGIIRENAGLKQRNIVENISIR
jgi:hypothetical protein